MRSCALCFADKRDGPTVLLGPGSTADVSVHKSHKPHVHVDKYKRTIQ